MDAAISGKADTSAVTAVNNVLTAHTADTTIHVTSADKTAWNAKSDFSGSYNDLTDENDKDFFVQMSENKDMFI